jgi:F-type H+-transporting ATPase subunit delta
MNLRSKAASRYARALLTLALEAHAEERISGDMALIARALGQSPQLIAFIRDTLLPRTSRRRALESLFRERIHPLTWNFLQLLESKRRLSLLTEICSTFHDLNDSRLGILRGEMISAAPAPASAVEAMAGHFGTLFGKTVLLRTRESSALLGGCRVQVGDIVYDFSLAARLRLAQHALTGA